MSLNIVQNQYTKWVYPEPIQDLVLAIQNGYWEIGDPELYWPIFWPRRRDSNDLDILIAGCGTNQAAYYAYQNPTWNVLGIDLSQPSLENQKYLKKKHGLKNLRLLQLDLNEIDSIGESFDFITSTGVLHHLQNPQKGLIHLKNVLRADGVINLMLYGKSLRMGVYILQDFFKEIGLKQSINDLELVKATLESLPIDHIVNRYIQKTEELSDDTAIVDTFLHPIDQAFWVKEIFELVRNSGLAFLGWCDPGEYALENMLQQSHPIWPKVNNLNAESKAHLSDLFSLSRGTHRFAVAHPEYVAKAKINFDLDSFYDCFVIPHRESEIIQPANPTSKSNAKIKRGNYDYEINYELANLIMHINSQVSIREAIEKLYYNQDNKEKYYKLAKEGFQILSNLGHVYILN